ncbi:hypothetical protein J6590_055429, partial [Homalodisca vitripennis]
KVVKQIWKNLRQEFRKQFSKTIKSGAAAPETPTWKYYDSMAFLKDQFLPRKSTGNLADVIADDSDHDLNEEESEEVTEIGQECDEPDNPQLDTENLTIVPAPESESRQQQKSHASRPAMPPRFNTNDLITRTGFKKRITTQAAIGRELVQLEKEKLKLKQQKSEDRANDEDVGFFNSLLPHVKNLNPRKKMLFRMKVQEILFDMAYSPEPPSSFSTTSTVTRPTSVDHSTSSHRYSPYDSSSPSTMASPSPVTFAQLVRDVTSPLNYNQDGGETYVPEYTHF